MVDQAQASIIVAVISLVASIIVAYINRDKVGRQELHEQRMEDAVMLERRLTTIEQNVMTGKERECLISLKTKYDLIYNFFSEELPRILKEKGS